MKRELFFWTKKLRVGMAELEREVNPFNLSTLRCWLDDSEDRIDTEARTTKSMAAAFWAIPGRELKLVCIYVSM